MGKKTKIDWCDSTWNPVTGCLHDCEYCYAKRIAERFGSNLMPIFTKYPVLDKPVRNLGIDAGKIQPYPFDFTPTFHRYRLGEPARWTRPRNIFVCSMADLFGKWVPDAWIEDVFKACDDAPQHRYLFLTKNPDRYAHIADLLPRHRHPPYVAEMWFGHSYTGIEDYRPIYISAVRRTFISIEPLLHNISENDAISIAAFNNWVIIGAETGNRKRKVVPEKSWVDKIVSKCDRCGVPVFMKESLRELMGSDFRQEFPWEV